MKVWIMIAGYNYEGQDSESIRVYSTIPTKTQEDELKKEYEYCDYILIEEREIINL